MPRTSLNGATIHYQQSGSGPDLVLVHGLFCNLAFWSLSVVPALAKRFRVTVYDLRGHGLSGTTPSGYRAKDLAGDLEALLDHLNIDSAHIAGHSFGGAVTIAYALAHPRKVRSILLADAWLPSLQAPPTSLRPSIRVRQRLRKAGLTQDLDLPKVAYGFLEELLDMHADGKTNPIGGFGALTPSDESGRQPFVLRRWQRLVKTTDVIKELYDREGIEREKLKTVFPPVTAIYGQFSRYRPTLRMLRQSLPSCRTQILPGSGHFFPIVQPDSFSAAIDTTIAEFGPSAGSVVSCQQKMS